MIAVASLVLNIAIIGWLIFSGIIVTREFGRLRVAIAHTNFLAEYNYDCQVKKDKEVCESLRHSRGSYLGAMRGDNGLEKKYND